MYRIKLQVTFKIWVRLPPKPNGTNSKLSGNVMDMNQFF